jgi:hypothetical protein
MSTTHPLPVRSILGAIGFSLLVLDASGCATAGKVSTIPGVPAPASRGLKPFERDEYSILASVEGKACMEDTCLFGACWTTPDQKDADQLEGRVNADLSNAPQSENWGPFDFLRRLFASPAQSTTTLRAQAVAYYRAIEAVPNADELIAPRAAVDENTFDALIYSNARSCVTVRGKAIHIKTDDELAASRGQSKGPPAATAAPTTPAPTAYPAPTPPQNEPLTVPIVPAPTTPPSGLPGK